jgi:hypothetical protein
MALRRGAGARAARARKLRSTNGEMASFGGWAARSPRAASSLAMAWSSGGIEACPGVPLAVSFTHRRAFSERPQAIIGGFVSDRP